MKRREFLTTTATGAAGLGLVGGLSSPACKTEKGKSATVAVDAASEGPFTPHALLATDEFSGASFTKAELTQIKRQYQYDLFEDFLPFMDRFVVDHEYGGFMCTADRDGTRLSTEKSLWYEGRGIWVYSFLYNNFGKDPKHLEVARKSVEFIMKHKPEGHEGQWPLAFSREGQAAGKPDVRTYGDLFISGGLAEYARATGDESYFQLAKEIALRAMRLFDKPDYWPESTQSYLGKDAPLTPGTRVQGVWFVHLNNATGMLDFHDDPEIKAIADRCLDAIMNYHWNPDFGLNNELINHDLSRPAGDVAQFVYTGHAIETMWMVLYEAGRRKDETLFEEAAKRFKRHVEVAWDDVYGGVFRSLNHVDKNLWLTDKVLWAQEEVLIGSLMAAEHTGAKWAKDWFVRMYNHVHDKWPLRKHGHALWNNATDRQGTYNEHYSRIENFHHPRHLMLNLLAIERMLGQKA